MRIEGAAPRVWLLATVAGWALLAWVLALAGMGGRVALLGDDPDLLQALPQPRPSPTGHLGPISEYAEVSARPVFANDRRPHPFSLQPDNADDESDEFDYVLTSVLMTPQLRMAIIQPGKGGDSIRVRLDTAARELPGWQLVELQSRSAVFEGPGGRRQLQLRVFDGKGGTPPTPIRDDASTTEPTAVRERQRQTTSRPMSAPAPINQVRNADAADDVDAAANDALRAQQQMDEIRERIEARRAQMRQDQQEQQAAPARKP